LISAYVLEDEDLDNAVLNMAGNLNITYSNATYLTRQKSNQTIVTDDEGWMLGRGRLTS